MGTLEPPPVLSPSGSLAGWSFLTLLQKNKDKVKLLVSALGAYATSQLVLIKDPELNTLVATIAGVVIYIASAAVDYWLSENPV